MPVNNNDILKVTMEFQLSSGTIVQNVWHYYASLAAQQADLTVQNTIEEKMEDIYNELSTILHNGMTQRLCTIDKVEFSDGKWSVTENVGSFTPTITFSGAGEQEPDQIAPFIVFGTARPKTKGRKFLFGLPEGGAVGSYLISSAVTALTAAAAEALASAVIGPLNTLNPGVPRVGVGVFYALLYGVVTNVVGTQRRRRPGVGI